MKYLCKESCFQEGFYFKAGEVYKMSPKWKPPKSNKPGVVLFERLTPEVEQEVEAELEAEKREAKIAKGRPLPETGMAASLTEDEEPEVEKPEEPKPKGKRGPKPKE